jgi:hypothetical protein
MLSCILRRQSKSRSLVQIRCRSVNLLSKVPDRRGAEAAKRGLRRPYRYAVALVLACASLISLVLLYLDRHVPVKDKLTEIGTGLVASIIFAVIYTVFANREFSELIKAEITGQLTDHMSGILREIKQLNELFLPTDQYPATRAFDPRFNRDITADMCHSSTYLFRGTSAKYVPGRLRRPDHRLELAQVILLDPRDRSAIEARAADRRRRPEHEGKARNEIEQEMRDEILLALVALFDCREQCDIEIGFSTATSSVRIELFDRAIYTSLYRSTESLRNSHPETARFGRDSQPYLIFKDECRRQMELATSRRRFTTRDTDADLIDFASSLGFAGVGQTEINDEREKYRAFIRPFINALTTMGAKG